MTCLGIDRFLEEPPPDLTGKRWGLLSNQASVNKDGYYSKDLLRGKFQNNLRCLFSPQHGFWGTEQDNMIETPHSLDHGTGLPLFSLYSRSRRPEPEMLRDIDVLLIDLQDIGTRVYTFITTLAYCLQEARGQGKEVVVLDRPNPLGGLRVEGNVLQSDLTSFVGVFSLPMRHGLTLGELALLFNRELGIQADLRIIPMKDWPRSCYFDQTGLPWIMPSPNMPALATAQVYPGQVLWEGTNLSEGRGTTRPFEIFGAPFVNPYEVKDFLRNQVLPGVNLIPFVFRPTFQKWQGQVCRGFFLLIEDRQAYKPYRTALILLQALTTLYPEAFRWKDPPYEYEWDRLPIDLLIGDQGLRLALEAGEPVAALEHSWQEGLGKFLNLRQEYLLYP
jgi:uncharacterized protein YbbC (DUF1343 family)